MFCSSLIGRSCHSSVSLPHLGHHLPGLTALTHHVTAAPANNNGSSSFTQWRLFNHERRHTGPSHKKHSKIVMKKKFVPDVFPSLEERLTELNPAVRDPEMYKKINIGLGSYSEENSAIKRRKQRAVIYSLKHDKALAKLARDNKLEIDVRAIQQEWGSDAGPVQTCALAEHCGIFKDLFGPYAFFNAVVPLTVEHDYSEDEVSVVYRGNILKPREANTRPTVTFASPPDALWTLQLTNPDGDLYRKDSECLHWLVTNIKGGDISSGDELVPYLPPFPPRGVGYQRMVFVLYRQTAPITDQEQYRLSDPLCLRSRSFATSDFYRQQEKLITPAGLCWYNTDWDSSLTDFFHHTLGMKEPVYEYQFPKPYLAIQKFFPEGQNFCFYMDMHRDPIQISTEMLVKRLKSVHPFRKEAPRLPYPDAQPMNFRLPSWQRQEIKRERLGRGKYAQLYCTEYDTAAQDEETLLEAAEIEVEKNHVLRLGAEWKKVHMGKKKAALLAEKEKLLEEGEEALDSDDEDDGAGKKDSK